MSIRFSNPFPSDRKERYYGEDRHSSDRFPGERKESYYVDDGHSFHEDLKERCCVENRRSGSFPEDRKERYYVENRHSYDDVHDKNAIAGPFRSSMASKSSAANAPIDWKETADAHVFRIELPGVKKHEVKVEVEENGVLCISGEIRAEKEEKSDMWRRVERSSGKFYQRISLPESADVDKVKAEMNNGVLTITVPKHRFRMASPRVVQISGH
ncbi:16.9 kDa class I heat shock protein 3-like [Momordica charantia]|uniref:16.9 kDa class I heat shock protein 3-like n=1 Tax=Momordica charantia TaxID=3673 RepID=A0A6J1CWJ7_MOMCH|nr:16.9 kDa class I heat shock protein 3-like [Momordica charantia]